MGYVPDAMILAKLRALPEIDRNFVLGLIDTRIARAALAVRPLRLVVTCHSAVVSDDVFRRG